MILVLAIQVKFIGWFSNQYCKSGYGVDKKYPCRSGSSVDHENCLKLFSDLNIQPLAEGVESHAEFAWLKAAGVELMQGYYFAKPGFESLPSVNPEFSEAWIVN